MEVICLQNSPCAGIVLLIITYYQLLVTVEYECRDKLSLYTRGWTVSKYFLHKGTSDRQLVIIQFWGNQDICVISPFSFDKVSFLFEIDNFWNKNSLLWEIYLTYWLFITNNSISGSHKVLKDMQYGTIYARWTIQIHTKYAIL